MRAPGLLDLPDDALFRVFDYLLGSDPLDGALQLTCRRLRALLVRPCGRPAVGEAGILTPLAARRRCTGRVSAGFSSSGSNVTRCRAR
jgi:hypothetical protein